MLTTLFGDLGPARGDDRKRAQAENHGFAATAILETVAATVNERGQIVDRHSQDIVVSGSPAAAIREHFAATRADLDVADKQIALLDPTGIWASSVIRALSDAGGQPIERLHLREPTTLRTLATIERTRLVRRGDETLKLYHADVRAPGPHNAEIPVALMERSHLTVVIVGPMQPHAIDALVGSLSAAVAVPGWRCPNLLFLLPPNAVWIANKIQAVSWPARLQLLTLDEPLTSASSVWNAILNVWQAVKDRALWEIGGFPPAGPAAAEAEVFERLSLSPASVPPASTFGTLTTPAPLSKPVALPERRVPPAVRAAEASRPAEAPRPDALRLERALAAMLPLDGLLVCAAVDAHTGAVLAREQREDHPVDVDRLGLACTRLLRAHREAASAGGVGEPVEEVLVGSGQRLQAMRVLSRHPEVFVVALLDRKRSNLPLARFKLLELDRSMV